MPKIYLGLRGGGVNHTHFIFYSIEIVRCAYKVSLEFPCERKDNFRCYVFPLSRQRAACSNNSPTNIIDSIIDRSHFQLLAQLDEIIKKSPAQQSEVSRCATYIPEINEAIISTDKLRYVSMNIDKIIMHWPLGPNRLRIWIVIVLAKWYIVHTLSQNPFVAPI